MDGDETSSLPPCTIKTAWLRNSLRLPPFKHVFAGGPESDYNKEVNKNGILSWV